MAKVLTADQKTALAAKKAEMEGLFDNFDLIKFLNILRSILDIINPPRPPVGAHEPDCPLTARLEHVLCDQMCALDKLLCAIDCTQCILDGCETA